MAVQSTDLILVERGGVPYKATVADLPSGGSGGLGAGELPVRYDATQPEVDCLWCAPDGALILITGS